MKNSKDLSTDTLLAHGGRNPAAFQGAVNVPVYHVSTVLFESLEELRSRPKPLRKGELQYGRTGTPTTFALEDTVAELEGAYGAIAVPSGLAAIAATLSALTKAGDHVLISDSVYGPTRAFCDNVLRRFGVEVSYYDPRIGGRIAELMTPATVLVFTESPGSQTFEVQDLPAIAAAAHAAGALVVTDNTWATPLYCKPLALGADVSLHAGTKYIVGHSDAMLGLILTGQALYQRIRLSVNAFGYSVGPDDAFLGLRGLRGLRSLSVRLARHQENGLTLARWLARRPEVKQVLHPALPDSPDHALWARDFTGACGLFGFILHSCSEPALAAMLDGLALFGMGYSWGGYESLLIPTAPKTNRTATAWDEPGQSLRLHAGLEDANDLIADLEAGFARFNQVLS